MANVNPLSPPVSSAVDSGSLTGGRAPRLSLSLSTPWKMWFNSVFTLVLSKLGNYGGFSYNQPNNAFALVVPQGAEMMYLDPSGTLASGSVVLPTSPFDCQRVYITSSKQITTLTVAASVGQAVSTAFSATLAANTGIMYQYVAAKNIWYRIL